MMKFYSQVDRYNTARGTERRKVEREIWRRFGARRTVFILDMSGFTVSVRRDGILAFLGKIRSMHRLVFAEIRKCGGDLVKFEADNAYAVFRRPAQAVEAALRVVELTRAHPEFGLAVSIGIAEGKILLVPKKDLFGDAVNLASKLGEDIASAGEVLVSRDIATDLRRGRKFAAKPLQVTVSGLKIPCATVSRA